MSAKALRRETIDAIQKALQHPEEQGGLILKTVVTNATAGFVSLKLIQGIIDTLYELPLSYIRHCVQYEQKVDKNTSLEYDEETEMVRMRPAKILIDPSNLDPRSENPEQSCDIVFDGEDFYDGQGQEPPDAPSYQPNLGTPFGTNDNSLDRKSLPQCWNCETFGHEISKCPKKRDNNRIRRNRELVTQHSNDGRFYEVVRDKMGYITKKIEPEPGKLSLLMIDALGLTTRYPYPEYYGKMRRFGYPPGYYGTAQDQEQIMALIKTPEEPELKVYDHPQDDEDLATDEPVASNDVNDTKFHMAYFPGLFDKAMPVPVDQLPQEDAYDNFSHQLPPSLRSSRGRRRDSFDDDLDDYQHRHRRRRDRSNDRGRRDDDRYHRRRYSRSRSPPRYRYARSPPRRRRSSRSRSRSRHRSPRRRRGRSRSRNSRSPPRPSRSRPSPSHRRFQSSPSPARRSSNQNQD